VGAGGGVSPHARHDLLVVAPRRRRQDAVRAGVRSGQSGERKAKRDAANRHAPDRFVDFSTPTR
jgi:hypothetical protein